MSVRSDSSGLRITLKFFIAINDVPNKMEGFFLNWKKARK